MRTIGCRIAVLTGGPGCGKTTLLWALAKAGTTTIPEAALQLIDELNAKLGVDGQQEWRRSHFIEFQELLVERQLQLEASTTGSALTIADRGLIDILGYCRFKNVKPPAKLTSQLLGGRYCVAFLLEPLGNFPDRRSTGRTSSREDALAIGECLRAAYLDVGVPVVRVPFMTVDDRAAYVLERLTQWLQG